QEVQRHLHLRKGQVELPRQRLRGQRSLGMFVRVAGDLLEHQQRAGVRVAPAIGKANLAQQAITLDREGQFAACHCDSPTSRPEPWTMRTCRVPFSRTWIPSPWPLSPEAQLNRA